MTHTISQVSRALSVSTRALRYYEEMGLIHSRRIEGYAYRVYDEDTVRRIEQILFLRSVRIPLRDIAVLLRGEDTRKAIEIFRRRIAEMDTEINQLTAVRRLLRYLQKKVSVSGSEGWKESVPLLPEDILLPRENSIPPMPSLPQDVRILSLPRLTVAAAHTIKMGDFHEWAALAGWAEQSPDWEIRWASDGTEIMGGSLEEHLNYLQDRAAGRLQTGQLDATLALGSAELGTVQAERVTIENAQGDVTISRLVGASQVQVTDQLGNIALTLGEKADGYSVQAACGMGSITVSGAKQASPYSANSKAANAVILDAALGDITLNFEE